MLFSTRKLALRASRAVAMAAITVVSLAGQTAELPRAKWLENGLIDAGGIHEPLSFMVRVGGGPIEARQLYERAQSEETIRRLKEQGVEVFHTHLFKGFGMAAEKSEMEDTVRAAAIAHRYGMKVDTYVQWDSLMYETFFAEEPRAADWVQRDALGQPILLSYGFEQSFRYRVCFSNPGYLEYLKKVIRYAVEQVKTDFIHFDNFERNAEPDSCHCAYCTRGFREYLKAKYPPALRRARFGFETLDYVNPPVWNTSNPPQKMEVIRDPVLQEWVAYRCHNLSEALRQAAEYVRSLNREVAVEVNPNGLTGENRPWVAGIDHTQFLKYTDAFWTEEENIPGFQPDGRLVSRIRSFKLARALRNILMVNPQGDPLALAEILAFNQTIGFLGKDPLSKDTRRYLDFYRQHRDLYVGAVDDPTVAVLRSYPSITYHAARAHLAAILVEQALLQSRTPFRMIFDDDLADLSRYKVLVLPESECLSDEQLAAIRAFVQKGGGLVAMGNTGLYNEWLRVRARPGLGDLLPTQEPGTNFGEAPVWRESAGHTVLTQFGKGRSAYVPGVQFDGPMPPAEPYFNIANQFWKNPRNAAQIVEAVRWAAGPALPVRVGGPDYLVANLVSQPAHHRRLLHLVNYNAAAAPVVSAVDVAMRPDGAEKTARVTLLSPDSPGDRTLPTRMDEAGLHFTIPEIRTYSVVVVDWQ